MPKYKFTDPVTKQSIIRDYLPTKEELIDDFKKLRDDQEAAAVPKWGQEHPNLYGAGKAVDAVREDLGTAVSNIPRSALDYVGSLVSGATTLGKQSIDAITSLPETLSSLPETLSNIPGNLKDSVIKKYGSLEALRKTAIEDPVGTAADLSLLLSGTGGLLSKGLEAVRMSTPARAVQSLNRTVRMIEPMNIAKNSALTGLTLLPKTAEKSLYKRGLRPLTKLGEAELDRRVDTALEERIPTTMKGLKASKQKISDINNEIQHRTNTINERGDVLSGKDMAKRAEEFMSEKIAKEAFPKVPTEQVKSVTGEFAEAHPEMNLREAQNYKQSINSELDNFHSILSNSPDKTAWLKDRWTQKTKAALADQLRVGIEQTVKDVFPEISKLNAREGALIQLNKSLYQAVNKISNMDLLSLKGIVATTKDPKLFLTHYILNNPGVQSRLAIAIRKARTLEFDPSRTTTLRQVLRAADMASPQKKSQNPEPPQEPEPPKWKSIGDKE